MTRIRSRAPLRISFAGGGTEVPPYLNERGGAVISTTIDKYVYSSVSASEDQDKVSVQSLDYDVVARYEADERLDYNGELDLVKAVLNRMDPDGECGGLSFLLRSDAPPGSGLGSSSTLVVALLSLFRRLRHLALDDYQLARLAYEIERKDLEIEGGMQDQYAAAFGGINYIEFHNEDQVVVNPLRIDPEIRWELESRLILCYTGKNRLSANILEDQVDRYERREDQALEGMDRLKEIAGQMKDALLQGRLDDFGALLHESWENKKKMSGKITNPHIDAMYEEARSLGAVGGKISGAGGGGYMLVQCEVDNKHEVARRLEEMGGQVVEFTFEDEGVHTWRVPPQST